MSDYRAPIKDMRFLMDEIAGLKALSQLPGFEEISPDLVDAVLEEAAQFTGGVLAPLNRVGDQAGCQLTLEGVTTPEGWKAAYQAFCAAGWNSMTLPPDFGGQGLPETLGTEVKEMVCSANLSFSLGPLLTTGAVQALLSCASDELKAIYLEQMVTGEWTGTMSLTEPQAGSDLALIRSRAEPRADGSYRVFGQKIFITARYLLTRSEGTIGELAHLLMAAAVAAVESGEEAINHRTLSMADYTGPSERRRQFERELM